VLVVAATHDEINGITHAIREDLKRTGALKPGEAFQKHSALNWTEAQKKSAKNYQPGQVLEFHKAVKGIARHESLEVVSADTNGIIGRKVDGQTVKVTMRQAKAFAVFESHDIEISVGDKLLLQCNWRDKAFKATNGELVTVASVEDGRIRLDDSCKLPTDYRQFTHGYAVTAHRSQGKTVDFEIIAAERMAQDLFYVSATRAREGLTVITSDRIGLEESIGVSGDRQSATELAYRAARSTRAEAFAQDDLFQIYQAQQQARELRRSRLFKGR
jgi:ATP-dependent exoDNAse (exonuclease V) alpha subunit